MSPPNPFPDPETKLTAGQIRHVDESVDRKQKKLNCDCHRNNFCVQMQQITTINVLALVRSG